MGLAQEISENILSVPGHFRLSSAASDDFLWQTVAVWVTPESDQGRKCELLLQVPRDASRIDSFFGASDIEGYENGELSLVQLSANCYEAVS